MSSVRPSLPQGYCLFAHYDPDGAVSPHVIHYVKALNNIGLSIIFVTTAALQEEDLNYLKRFCLDVIQRENAGLDFGSWAIAFQRYRDVIRGNLFLVNDSVYAPAGDLSAAVTRLCSQEADFYGMVESGEILPHLQSWFLIATPQVYQSEAFTKVLLRDFSGSPKDVVIREGEIALTESIKSAGFRIASLFSYKSLHGGMAFNPTHFLWRELLLNEQIPFIKVSLFRNERDCSTGLKHWRKVVEPLSQDLAACMEEHLSRLAERRRSCEMGMRHGRWRNFLLHSKFRLSYRLSGSRRLALVYHCLCDAAAHSVRFLRRPF